MRAEILARAYQLEADTLAWMLVIVTLVAGSTPEIILQRFPTPEACRQVTEVLSEMVSQMPEVGFQASARRRPITTSPAFYDVRQRGFVNVLPYGCDGDHLSSHPAAETALYNRTPYIALNGLWSAFA